MIRRPRSSTRTATLFPYPTPFRPGDGRGAAGLAGLLQQRAHGRAVFRIPNQAVEIEVLRLSARLRGGRNGAVGGGRRKIEALVHAFPSQSSRLQSRARVWPAGGAIAATA